MSRSLSTLSQAKRDQSLDSNESEGKPRLSASLILIRPLDSPTNDGYNYQTLLLQRHATRGSFLSAHVFPGGNIDRADSDSFWRELPENNLRNESAQRRALKVCAIRETFEESGILVGSESLTEKERRDWRKKVHDNAADFSSLFTKLTNNQPSTKISLATTLSSLIYRGNYVTPRGLIKRWDTHFYITVLPSSSIPTSPGSSMDAEKQTIPDATSDGVETVLAEWLTPLEAVRKALLPRRDPASPASITDPSNGPILFAPPQFYFLAELVPFRDWRDLIDENTGNLKGRKVLEFEPEIKSVPTPSRSSPGRESYATVLPGDPYHSRTPFLPPSAVSGAMHRTYIETPGQSKSAGGLRILGVRRRGMGEVLGEGWEDMKAGEGFDEDEDGQTGKSRL